MAYRGFREIGLPPGFAWLLAPWPCLELRPTRHIHYDHFTALTVVFGQGQQLVEDERWILSKSAY